MNEELSSPYQAKDIPSIDLGGILLDATLLPNAPVNLVLKSFNRHGLIAGATGTGKTKTMQVLCEQLSQAGVPSLVMDVKGDISGLAMPGQTNDSLQSRSSSLGLSYLPRGFPVELFTLNEAVPGIPLRATLAGFGSLLFARMLDLNETQSGVLTIVFEFTKDKQLPLIDLNDLKAVLQYMQSDKGKAEIESTYGSVASTSIGSIMRKIIELEAQGGDVFFGEPALKVDDLLHVNSNGQGVISVLRLMDMQEQPQIFSTFMLKLLSDMYRQLPEVGDPLKPKLVLFIDEAHLIFNNATKALLNSLITTVKLIRSKGVGLIFCTQTPNDIPEEVLSQLGLKIQHALRAFTAKDRQAMKLVAQNFPPSTFYKTEQVLTALGTGEALVSALDAKGQPTPLIQCMVRAPESRMGTLTESELNQLLSDSSLNSYYRQHQKRASAADMLKQSQNEKIAEPKNGNTTKQSAKADPSILETLSKNTLARQVTRDLFRWVLKAITNKK